MLHITFGSHAAQKLTEAQELDETLAGQIIILHDTFYIGPLQQNTETPILHTRKQFWEPIWQLTQANQNEINEKWQSDEQIIQTISTWLEQNPNENATIWMAQNANDVCGYYYLSTLLKPWQGRIHVIYLNNLPFINEKGSIFYPSHLTQIPAKEFLKAKKLSRAITPSEFEIDPDEWQKLCEQNDDYRILEGGKKISGLSNAFFDEQILKAIAGPIKINKLVNNLLGSLPHFPSDMYLVSRILHLLQAEQLFITKEAKKWQDIEIANAATVNNESTTIDSDMPAETA
jgi:hypothetical protein